MVLYFVHAIHATIQLALEFVIPTGAKPGCPKPSAPRDLTPKTPNQSIRHLAIANGYSNLVYSPASHAWHYAMKSTAACICFGSGFFSSF
jgi:hypothetical protein